MSRSVPASIPSERRLESPRRAGRRGLVTPTFSACLFWACGGAWPNQAPLGQPFPDVQGNSLAGEEVQVPQTFAGAPTILLVSYTRESQFDIDRWLLGLTQLETPARKVELPTARGLFTRLFGERLDESMRRGIPREDWPSVVTVYRDAETITRFLGAEGRDNARVVLLDGSGVVRWMADQGYSSAQASALDDEVRGLAPATAGSPPTVKTAAKPGPAAGPLTVSGPRIRVLGVAQDGGLPHAGCRCERCEAARHDPARASGVASLGLIAPEAGKVYLVDATPDIIDQLTQLEDVRDARPGGVDREPVDGILLTHAHIGHYLGLAHFGFEAISTKGIPVWASARMAAFLRENGPWSQLVKLDNIRLQPARPGEVIELADGIRVTPLGVPHRAEYTDTLGYTIAGPNRRVLYIPDCSPWHAWKRDVKALVEGIDVALLDATFYCTWCRPLSVTIVDGVSF